MLSIEEFFEALENQLRLGKPFVAYRKPGLNTSLMALLQDSKDVFFSEDLSESGFVLAPFSKSGSTYLIPQESSSFLETNYEHNPEVQDKNENEDYPPELLVKLEKVQHENLVQKGIDAIKSGVLTKVVLSRKETQPTQLKSLEIFKSLLKQYNLAFVYLWFHPETGIWIGATPETLLSVERNKFKTMALAGTQAYKNIMQVTWGKKEQVEQQIVTDAILDNLKQVNIERLEVSEAYTSRAGNLLHLRTDICGYLKTDNSSSKKLGLKEIVSVLHPTPAVCGLPTKKAEEFILDNEGYQREYYTGYLGEINLKSERKRSSNRKNQENQAYTSIVVSSSLYVNLRCMKYHDGKASLFIGGGITKDSDPAKEWEETVNKAQTLKSVLIK